MASPRRSVLSLLLLAVALPLGGAHHEAADLATRLRAESRSAEDRARDAQRRPAEVIAFLGIAPGDTVIDLIAAGGWYTEVLSLAVGPQGRVYAQNGAYVLQMREGANDKALTARLAGGRLPNVERLDREIDDLGLAPDSVDAALTALNFHDVYNTGGPEAAAAFLAAVRRVLKPGGVLGIVDHAGGAEGADDAALHRIEEKHVREAARAAGFEVEAASDVLRHPDDGRTRNVFEPGLRGETDRFVLRLRKPAKTAAP